ncbi:MAG: NUDIX domain-containing protein [Thiomicrorhabdus chilensis]|uniref:NUDIX domain-containing protein n=1 Tax=Thiomicrorhabdus chilensis TaxID=63656 RepID=UPI00299F4F79|nr:NUDIX domain-containing protein [Thiomicrorhabdus chilensis]MDX1348058.1 NUDIX domain-containing protein [Thiomicrorhabdus chilensis]
MVKSKNCAKAVIIQNDKMLLIKKQYENGEVVYTLPGGTQEAGESLQNTVKREALEEVAAKIEVKGLLSLYEHTRPSKTQPNELKHKVEFAFLCEIMGDYSPQNGFHPDPHQHSVEWISLSALKGLSLDPPILSTILQTHTLPDKPVYLGLFE